MEIFEFGYKYSEKSIICLGYFDALHKGHKSLINYAKTVAEKEGLKLGVLLFTGNKSESDVFTFNERIIILKTLGVDFIIYAHLDSEFMSISPKRFTDVLFNNYNVKSVVCGEDYTYGYMAKGNVSTLIESAKEYGVSVFKKQKICDKHSQVISTTRIKNYLKNGEISVANELLDGNYFIFEKVLKGKGVGKNLGFPTANMMLSSDKFLIKQGVYLTFVIIDNKIYSALTNVGKQPTFNGNNCVIETYINGFNKDIYDKYLTVYFVDFLREITRFSSTSKLIEQLNKDKELLND